MYFTVLLQHKVFQRLPGSDTAFRNVILQRHLVSQVIHTTQSTLEILQIYSSASESKFKNHFYVSPASDSSANEMWRSALTPRAARSTFHENESLQLPWQVYRGI